MKKYIKYMRVPLDNQNRNIRELSVVSEFDCEVRVCSLGLNDHIKAFDTYTVYQRKYVLSKNSLIRKFQVLYNLFLREPNYLRHQNAYCISCHDLIALFVGWMSTWFIPKKKKPLLIYDSHEFEIGRNVDGKRNKLTKFIIPKLEKFLIRKSAFSIMVNDSIANEVQRIYELKEKAVIVRNIPNYWVIDDEVCNKRRKEICAQLRITDDTFIVMYHGGIARNRGIEKLLLSIQSSKNVVAVILGYGDKAYIEQLKQLSEQLSIAERILFHEAVPIDILWQYVGAADVGMITIPAVSKSYYYMLPNKLFENIQSETPIIGSSFPEISKIVNKYDIGLLVDPENDGEIVNAIEQMRTDKDMYSRFKKNIKKAKEELCWENEHKALKKAYAKILS